jgi:hypothetical protein
VTVIWILLGILFGLHLSLLIARIAIYIINYYTRQIAKTKNEAWIDKRPIKKEKQLIKKVLDDFERRYDK